MDRRGFIQSVLGAAVMAVVPNNDGVELRSMKHPTSVFIPGNDLTRMVDEVSGEVGFGLAPNSILHERGAAYTADFAKRVAKDVNQAVRDHYAMEPDSFEDLWIDIEP